jgi:hemerythrin
MGSCDDDLMEFMFGEHEKFISSLSKEELEKYEKDMAIIKLRPFLKTWILKHFGLEYLKIKADKEKKRIENLNFYYAITQDVYYY